MVFSWFYHENRLVDDFDYHIRNQRVKIHKYTKFEENRKIQLFGTLSKTPIAGTANKKSKQAMGIYLQPQFFTYIYKYI